MGDPGGISEITYSRARIGWMLFAVLFSMVVQGFGTFKLIPMQDAIQSFFHVNEGAYGILSSSQNWLMIALSVPLGYLARKLPCKWSLSIGFLIAAGGMAIQLVTHSFPVFVAGRIIEGFGFGFVYLTASALILTLVPEKRRGFWSSLMIVAAVLPQVIITKGGATLMERSGMTFQGVFAIIGGVYLFAFILWMIIVPGTVRIYGVADSTKPTKEQTRRVYRNPSLWLVSVAFICFNVVTIGFTSYVIKFLGMKGMALSQAASTYSYTTLIGIASMILLGLLADKLGTKRKLVIVGFLACALALVFLAVLPVQLIYIYVILYGTLPRSIAGLTNAASADIAEVPSDIPIVSSVRHMLTQIGSVLMTIVMGYLIQYLGYEVTIFILAGESLLGAILWLFAKRIP